jgi:hypothetical protein
MESMRGFHRSGAETQPLYRGRRLSARSTQLHVALSKLVHQSLETGGRPGRIRPQIALQPLAHGVADRSAGLAIDLFADIGGMGSHRGVR